MRQSRVRVDERDTWYHCYNRIAGTSKDLPFGRAEKEQFVRILRRVSILYTVKIVSYQVMSNHFHLLVLAPEAQPDPDETCRRYAAFHRGKRSFAPDSEACRLWQSRCRDISWLMRHIQQLFTAWYNRTRPIRRRGSLWADRFKHTILEGGNAVWSCWKYIEANGMRAGMVRNASDYRFCSYGIWSQTGRHPFEKNLGDIMLPLAEKLFGIQSSQELRAAFSKALDEEEEAADAEGFTLSIRRRVRYWTQGLVIGSELFVKDVMFRHKPRSSRRMARVRSGGVELCAGRKLRPAVH